MSLKNSVRRLSISKQVHIYLTSLVFLENRDNIVTVMKDTEIVELIFAFIES